MEHYCNLCAAVGQTGAQSTGLAKSIRKRGKPDAGATKVIAGVRLTLKQ